MLTEEQINYHANGCCTSGECNIGRKELADEIKRLRAQCAALTQFAETRRVQINELMDELARYKTPQVDSADFPDPDCVCHETSTRNCPVHQNDGGKP